MFKEDFFCFTDVQQEEIKKNLRDGKSGKLIFSQKDKQKYVVYTPCGVEDWVIFSMVDKEAAILQYKKNDEVIERSMIAVLMLFIFSLIATVILVILHLRNQKQMQKEHFFQYHKYRWLMEELESPVFQYNIQDDSLIGNKKYQEIFGQRSASDFMKKGDQWKKIHPEYNFNGLFAEIRNVIKYQKIIMFESMMQLQQKNCWIKNILVPIKDELGGKFLVFGVILDTTKEHELFDEVTEIMANPQIGLYRFHLKDSFHIEYMNEGLQKMLGYTAAETDAIIGCDGAYLNLLERQDWDKYKAFVRKVTDSGENDTCEYSMICKDGSRLKVSDTLEMKNESDGDKYGYGVVIDISEYRDAQKKAEQNLEKLKIQLNESRIKISTGQMQPHFLYNALASIREIVLENPDYAADLIFDFTTHLRACIKSMASEELTSFSQEIENIKAYVNIEKMRFGDKLQVQYDIQESNFNIVPLSIQPLVENAIRHGIYERGSIGGIVKISSYRDAEDIVIRVEDNGVGFEVEKIRKELRMQARDSTGLQSLIFRFENLMHANVKVESVVGEGTKITVRIPMKGAANSESNYRR
ncbi:MAG: histidine kinase [Marvinbryantia sp.]